MIKNKVFKKSEEKTFLVMLLDGISISAQYLENIIKEVLHNFKGTNILQVITSEKKKKIFNSLVHIFSELSGKSLKAIEFRHPKGCQIKQTGKKNDSHCI